MRVHVHLGCGAHVLLNCTSSTQILSGIRLSWPYKIFSSTLLKKDWKCCASRVDTTYNNSFGKVKLALTALYHKAFHHGTEVFCLKTTGRPDWPTIRCQLQYRLNFFLYVHKTLLLRRNKTRIANYINTLILEIIILLQFGEWLGCLRLKAYLE